ncbi:MAG: TIGR02302 family protein [Pseudomonadota bacterium]
MAEEQVRNGRSLDKRLQGSRTTTAIAIAWERLWPLLMPLFLVVSLFLSVSWFDLWKYLPDLARYALLGVFGIGTLYAISMLRHFRAPTSAQIDTRLERFNALAHQPISTQSDSIEDTKSSPFARALWREHKKRMSDRVRAVRADLPRPSLAERDPYALRAIAPLLLFIAFGYGAGNHFDRIVSAFTPQSVVKAREARLDAWVTPPAYTNRPPIFLTRKTAVAPDGNSGKAWNVPEASKFVLRIANDVEASVQFETSVGTSDIKPATKSEKETDDPVSEKALTKRVEYQFDLKGDGDIVLMSGETELKRWAFTVIEDTPPQISHAEPPSQALRGALQLLYQIKDDYGVASARAEIRPVSDDGAGNGSTAGNRAARPLYDAPDFSLPLPRRNAKAGVQRTSRDLTNHPWAGAMVSLKLVATDVAGKIGESEAHEFLLPSRRFSKPLAAAIAEQRRILAMDARSAPHVAAMLDVFTTHEPETFINDAAVYMGIRVARRSIQNALTDDDLRKVVDLLWDIALDVEDGDLSNAERRLREAQERLSEALENGASDEEIDKLMKELREAMNEFMKELAQQAMRNQNQDMARADPNTQMLSQRDLDRMMDQIENLAKSGSKDAARELLNQLQQMMDNLQAGRHQQQRMGEDGDQFRKQMNELADMMKRQQDLMDQTFGMQRQRQNQQGQQGQQGQRQQNGQRQGQQGGQQNQGGQRPMTAEEFAQALKQLQKEQGALQDRLKQFMDRLNQQGTDAGRELGDAGKAMGNAKDALGEGNNGQAVEEQGRALQAMRKGAQQMMQQMQQMMAGERGGTDPNGQQRNGDPDPLGRRQQRRGPDFGESVDVPDEIDAQRARKILEAIRRRLSEPFRPKVELDYLDRLLKSR